MRLTPKEHYERGIELFNSGQFFECHEAWEEVWKRAEGTEKIFLQGLIQAAVAILHAQRGNLAGAATLLEKARVKLDPLPEEFRTLKLGEFRDQLKEFLAPVTNRRAPVGSPPKLLRAEHC